jgi:hypothetical protein
MVIKVVVKGTDFPRYGTLAGLTAAVHAVGGSVIKNLTKQVKMKDVAG